MTVTTVNTATSEVALGCWTILDEESDTVRATVTRERHSYTVRDQRGRVVGTFPTAQQALASVAA
ncbi:MAG: hypothetical protein M3N46_07895 [Actinomycetota bacterium]|nr:hypothetical protein [Actinomycetota bacterium]